MKTRIVAGAAFGLVGLLVAPGSIVTADSETVGREQITLAAAGANWKLLGTFPGAKDDLPSAIKVFNGKDLWAFTGREFNDDKAEIWEQPRPRGYHWNGRTWRRVPFASGQTGYVEEVAGTSGSDLWVTVSGTIDSKGMLGVLRWNGKSWSVSKRLTDVLPNYLFGLAVPSRGRVRAFATIVESDTRALRYDGRTWTRRRTGIDISSRPAVVSDRDIWAAAQKKSGISQVFHYNGTTWKKNSPARGMMAPKIRSCEDGEWPGKNTFPCLNHSGAGEVLAHSKNDIVVSVPFMRYDSANKSTYVTRLLRWNGKKWTRLGKDIPHAVGSLTKDGSGGLWFIISDNEGEQLHLIHRTRKGRLLQYPMPSKKVVTDDAGPPRRNVIRALAVAPGGTVYAIGTIPLKGDKRSNHVWKLTP